jgi:hypothetical protein
MHMIDDHFPFGTFYKSTGDRLMAHGDPGRAASAQKA